MSQPQRALDLVLDVHGGDPWHGFSTRRILHGITARQAAAPPPGGAHSIWAIVLHMTAWTHEVAARLRGGEPGEPAEGDYPELGEPTEARWQAACVALDAAQEDLADAVRGVPETLWNERLERRDQPAETAKTRLETLEGLAVHHGYHAGQIAILKRILGARG